MEWEGKEEDERRWEMLPYDVDDRLGDLQDRLDDLERSLKVWDQVVSLIWCLLTIVCLLGR